jgi:N-acetylmuramic acid 6-phosphate etherase
MDLDRRSVRSAIGLMLSEDASIAGAVEAAAGPITRAIGLMARSLRAGGRLFYVGAGTSGRLGVLDASECPPTFGTDPEQVQAIMAGGREALWSPKEGGEDDAGAGANAVVFRGVRQGDVVVGIAASGRTPFVWGALNRAQMLGAATVLLCFNPNLRFARGSRPTVVIAVNVGPEVLTGSTRLKAGTGTKLVLNLMTTLAMVQLGKVRSNLMVDVKATNTKLRGRAVRIVSELGGVSAAAAQEALERCAWDVRRALALV